jgi:SAM-dependent methyltransferase
VTSQREIWDSRYREREPTAALIEDPSPFARRVASMLTVPSDVLELGCGMGWDAAYFAGLGHRVRATDFADSVIEAARVRFNGLPELTFRVLEMPDDITDEDRMPDLSFDVVYARLSLHYFDNVATRRIFNHIPRLLRPGGLLAFMCKSTDDPLYGKGTKIESNMFESNHLRHFFSESYARSVLGPWFDPPDVVSRSGRLYDSPSAWIEVVATLR